jgi:arabinofuranosyltransferase
VPATFGLLEGRVDVRRRLTILWLSLFGLALARTAWVGDDAYFTFRTIDNAVHGYGLRWNVAERVQAYTHPLWMLLLTPLYWLTGEPYFTSIAVAMALTLLTVWLLLRRAPSAWSAAAGLTVLLGSRAFIDYSTSGLENPLTHLLLVLFLGRAISERRPATPTMLLAGLLLLNRLDLAFLVGPVLVTLLPWTRSWRAYRPVAIGLLPLALWELFSIVYYGFPVPNTAFAKIKTGVPSGELLTQGFTYVLDSVARDPLTLLAIVATAVWAVVENPRRTRPIGIAMLLHLAVVTYAGGDFMSGRMFAAPLVAAVFVLVRCDAADLIEYDWTPTLLAAVIGIAAFRAIAIGQAVADANDIVAASGVSDERAAYFRSNGLVAYARDAPFWPRNKWIENGIQARAEGPRVLVYCCNGMFGYAAGPSVHIVDSLGLGDPLLARLPAEKGWRVGHFGRAVPRGYVETLETGANRTAAPFIAAYYSRLSIITRGPLWDRRRLLTILRMNLGTYESLLDQAASGAAACGYTLLRTVQEVEAGGGRGSLTAEASSQATRCRWRARFSDSWITLRDAASGEGTATLNFTVGANPPVTERIGTIVVSWDAGSATFTVRQKGITNCTYGLTPTAQIAGAGAMDYSLTVTPSDASCSWKAEPTVPWIAIAHGNSNTGGGTVVYRVQSNDTHRARSGSISVTGLQVGRSALMVTQTPE